MRRLEAVGRAYACACCRRDVVLAVAAPADGDARAAEGVYPGTCRGGLGGKRARSIRFRVDADGEADGASVVEWVDRRLGPQAQDVARAVGDFVLERADGIPAYQLAVVVDDAEQGVTDVVRGEDLADSTARQIVLQRALGVPTPRYLHVPIVRAADGTKLSKQTGALPVALDDPLAALREAGDALGLDARGMRIADWLASARVSWRRRYVLD
jgi:glutamyl-Q tRNA(Asp) synthetase